MKKVLLATAVAVMAFTSCSQSEEFENAGQKAEINFTPVVKKSARAAIMNTTSLQSGFKVYAYNVGTEGNGTFEKPIMPGIEVTYQIDAWKYNGNYYWPDGAKIKFFAYAPSTSTAASYAIANPATDTDPKITYTVSAVGSQEDLVVAKTLPTAFAEGGVTLAFDHALTQVNFSAKGEDDFTYNLTKVEIQGVANQGTYSFGNTWEVTGGSATYSYPIGATPVVIGKTATDLMQENGALMLLPQTFDADSQAKIVVSYTVTDTNNDILYTASNKDVALKSSTAWGFGKKMRYTLTLTNGAKSISFDAATVNEWTPDKDDTTETPSVLK